VIRVESARSLRSAGGTLFFLADDGTHGKELWKSDGTTAGTVLVEDIHPGSYDSSYDSDASYLTPVRGRLFFTSRDGLHGPELWTSDGTAAGTVLVEDIHPCARHDPPRSLTAVGRRLLFTADDGVHGRELWKSNGTRTGTSLVKDINLIAPEDAAREPGHDAVGEGGGS
jgi:ELWxxDGT repeat protein